MNIRLLIAAATMSVGLASQPASAAILFDLGPGNVETNLNTEFSLKGVSGLAQFVSVTQNTTITDIAFSGYLSEGGNAKFFIADENAITLLFQTIVTFGSSSSASWLHSGPMSWDLQADHAYAFGIIAEAPLTLDGIQLEQPGNYSENGLTATGFEKRYTDYNNPHPAKLATKGRQLVLRLEGSQIASAVPEPSTWALLVLGFAGVGCMTYRRRKHSTAPGAG